MPIYKILHEILVHTHGKVYEDEKGVEL